MIHRRWSFRIGPLLTLAALVVELVQGERVWPLAERHHAPRPSWSPFGDATFEESLVVDGPARRDADWIADRVAAKLGAALPFSAAAR